MPEEDQNQEIGALNREKNTITHPVSQIPGYAIAVNYFPLHIYLMWIASNSAHWNLKNLRKTQ